MVDAASMAVAFPRLTETELELMRPLGEQIKFADGDIVFQAGDADIDFHVVEDGEIEIINPADDNKTIVKHGKGQFAGDIDLLTRRPVLVTAIARGPNPLILKLPGNDMRRLLATVPRLGEKLIEAFSVRRQLLQTVGVLGMKVIGPARSAEMTQLKEFLYRNFVPFTWYEPCSDQAKALFARHGKTDRDVPLVECNDGQLLVKPDVRSLAKCAGLKTQCPDRIYDLAVIGSGPAGMTSAVYAASEGLSSIVIDRLGPGGQAGGSSMIENFIGFPSGLSGAELATRSVLQMLKFGAHLMTPVDACKLRRAGELFEIDVDDGDPVQARTVLVATGVRWRTLQAENAERFERAGIYYAATSIESRVCSGRPTAVVGGGNSGAQAAMFLSECSPKVYMLLHGESLDKGMSHYLADRIRACDRIEVISNVEVCKVLGDKSISGVEICNRQTEERRQLDCSSIFVFIGAQPHSDWLPAEIARDAQGYVLTGPDAHRSGQWNLDREPCQLETTMPGVLAAGDVRAGSTKRVGFAVGDGAMAVTCVHKLRNL